MSTFKQIEKNVDKKLCTYKATSFYHEKKNIMKKSIFPQLIRCLIPESSGSGKIKLLWNIITQFWIPYKNLYIFTKSTEHLIYGKFQEMFNNSEEI